MTRSTFEENNPPDEPLSAYADFRANTRLVRAIRALFAPAPPRDDWRDRVLAEID